MRQKLIIPISLLAAGVFLALVLLSGCEPIKVEGPQMENAAPWISWAVTPSDSMVHSFNPTLHWFGADQDGQINNYFYGVFQAAYLDSVARENSLDIPDTLTWISLGNVTQATIPLVASPDSSISVGQYVVLKAVDDGGNTSNIINRYLLRTNHRPTCIITVPEEPQWSLPDTTSTWRGISITWEGGDSLDYIGAQPDFLWDVRVFGPYADMPDSTFIANFDTVGEPLYLRLTDNDSDPNRVSFTSYNFTNLLTGFYIFFARDFDDADVPSVPALGVVEVYEPHWIRHPNEAKDILIYNSTTFTPPFPADPPGSWADSIQMFYANALSDAGIASDKWDWFDNLPNIRSLYLYRMVIIDDLDWSNDIVQNTQEAFRDYLDIGGKMWVIGRMSFFNARGSTGLYEYENNGIEPLPFEYFGLAGAYFPSILGTPEFIGADAYDNVSATFPDISVDTLKVQGLNGNYDYAMPQVEFLILAPGAQSIYKFDALNPNASGTFNGFPVAVRYETSTLRTSYFSFPLFMMKYDQAVDIFNAMFDWFLDR